MSDFFEEMRIITAQHCELSGLPVPKFYPCDNARCDARVEKSGDLCGACQGRLDAQIDALEERKGYYP